VAFCHSVFERVRATMKRAVNIKLVVACSTHSLVQQIRQCINFLQKSTTALTNPMFKKGARKRETGSKYHAGSCLE